MTSPGEAPSWQRAWAVYTDPPVLRQLFLGFSSGLPLLLVFSTLSAWLKEYDVSKTTIGFVSLVGAAYTFKFAWSPFVDQVRLPLLGRWLGRRRGWMLLSQVALVVTILFLANTNPSTPSGLRDTILCAVLVAFASATQDVVLDAYRVDVLAEHQLGAGSAIFTTGYRIGMLAAGAGVLYIAQYRSWTAGYSVMAGAMLIGIVTTLVSPEPTARPGSAGDVGSATAQDMLAATRLPGWIQRSLGWLLYRPILPGLASSYPRLLADLQRWLDAAVLCPFVDFMRRKSWLTVLLFVFLYKYGDALLGVMANPFYLEIGFDKAQIATVSKLYGTGMTLVGAAIGGTLVARFGILRSLFVGGVLQALANLSFAWLAHIGPSIPGLIVAISLDNLCGGIGNTAFVAYLSSLCNIAYTATQFALLSSLMAFARNIFGAGAGVLADAVSWTTFFILTTVAAIPGLLALIWLTRAYAPIASGAPISNEGSTD